MSDLGAILLHLQTSGYEVENLRSKAGTVEVIYPGGTAQQIEDATALANSWVNPDETLDTSIQNQQVSQLLTKALEIKTRILVAQTLVSDLTTAGKTTKANVLQGKIDAWQTALETRLASL